MTAYILLVDNYLLWIPVISLLLVFAYQMYLRFNPHKTEEAAYIEEQRKKEVTRIVSSRKDRKLTECLKEEAFWQFIESTRKSAKDTYKSRIGVLRDKLSNKLDPEGLIKFDNRYNAIIEENISQDILAAATIIFGEKNPYLAVLLLNIFMFEGEIFFKNACVNPDLIIGKDIKEFNTETVDGHVADLYFRKTNQLIPIYKPEEKEFKIPGEEWLERDLPKRYPILWDAFA